MDNIPHGTPSGYTNGKCRCELCREAIRKYHQEQRDKKRAEDLEGYNRKRAEEARQYRIKHPDKAKALDRKGYQRAHEKGAKHPESIPHGSRSGYQTFGCRCDACREAQRSYEQERKARDPDRYAQQSRDKARRWKERHPDRVKEQAKLQAARIRERNPEKVADEQKKRNEAYRLRIKGIDAATEALLSEQQNGICAVCGKPDTRKLCIDHCHETGRVRGLLCRRCNLGLGCFGDDASLMKLAIEYLDKENT